MPGHTRPAVLQLRRAVAANNNDFDPIDDAAATVQVPEPRTPIFSRINASLNDGSQDFSYIGRDGPSLFPTSFWTGVRRRQLRRSRNRQRPESNLFGRSSGFCMNVGAKSRQGCPCSRAHGRRGEDIIMAAASRDPPPPLATAACSPSGTPRTCSGTAVTAPIPGFGQIIVTRTQHPQPAVDDSAPNYGHRGRQRRSPPLPPLPFLRRARTELTSAASARTNDAIAVIERRPGCGAHPGPSRSRPST